MDGRPTVSLIVVLELQGIQPLLVIIGSVLVKPRQAVCRRAVDAVGWPVGFPSVRLLGDECPFSLPRRLSCTGAGLLLRVFVGAVVKELGVDFHKQLHGVIDHAVDRPASVSAHTSRLQTGVHIPIPVALGVLIEGSKHDGENDVNVVADKVAEILVVPEVQGSLGDLEVRAGNGFGQLVEEGFLDLCELTRIHDLKDVLDFVQEHDFLRAVDLGPIAQEAQHDLFGEGRVLLQELHDAIRQLRMVHAQALDLVERYQDSGQEELVLFLQRKGEAIDDGPEDLEQLGDSIEPLGLIGKLEKDIVDGAADERSEVEELSINAMEGRLQKVAFPRVLGVEQLQKLQDEAVVDVGLGNVGVEILAFDEAKEELIDNLDVWPCHFQDWFVLFRIKSLALGVHGRRDGAEEVLGKHLHDPGVHGFRNDLAVIRHIVEKLVERQSLDLLGLHIRAGIVEVEDDVALVDLAHEQVLPLVGLHLVEAGKLLKVAMERNIKAGRVLLPGRLGAFQDVLGALLQPVVHKRLLPGLWRRRQIMRHGLGRTRGRDMLQRSQVRVVLLEGMVTAEGGTNRSTRADYDGWGQRPKSSRSAPAIGSRLRCAHAAKPVRDPGILTGALSLSTESGGAMVSKALVVGRQGLVADVVEGGCRG